MNIVGTVGFDLIESWHWNLNYTSDGVFTNMAVIESGTIIYIYILARSIKTYLIMFNLFTLNLNKILNGQLHIEIDIKI